MGHLLAPSNQWRFNGQDSGWRNLIPVDEFMDFIQGLAQDRSAATPALGGLRFHGLQPDHQTLQD